MKGNAGLTPSERRQKLANLGEEHELTFLDLCDLMLWFASKTDMSIKWNHTRVLVHVKALRKAKAPKVLGHIRGGAKVTE